MCRVAVVSEAGHSQEGGAAVNNGHIYTFGTWTLTVYASYAMLSDGYHAPMKLTLRDAADLRKVLTTWQLDEVEA